MARRKKPPAHVVTLTRKSSIRDYYVSDDGVFVQVVTRVPTRCRTDVEDRIQDVLNERPDNEIAAIVDLLERLFPCVITPYRVQIKCEDAT